MISNLFLLCTGFYVQKNIPASPPLPSKFCQLNSEISKLACSQFRCSMYCESNLCIHVLLPCSDVSACLALVCTSEYRCLTGCINSYHATIVTHTLDVQYIIFSWVTNFPYLYPPNSKTNGVCSSPGKTSHSQWWSSMNYFWRLGKA